MQYRTISLFLYVTVVLVEFLVLSKIVPVKWWIIWVFASKVPPDIATPDTLYCWKGYLTIKLLDYQDYQEL